MEESTTVCGIRICIGAPAPEPSPPDPIPSRVIEGEWRWDRFLARWEWWEAEALGPPEDYEAEPRRVREPERTVELALWSGCAGLAAPPRPEDAYAGLAKRAEASREERRAAAVFLEEVEDHDLDRGIRSGDYAARDVVWWLHELGMTKGWRRNALLNRHAARAGARR